MSKNVVTCFQKTTMKRTPRGSQPLEGPCCDVADVKQNHMLVLKDPYLITTPINPKKGLLTMAHMRPHGLQGGVGVVRGGGGGTRDTAPGWPPKWPKWLRLPFGCPFEPPKSGALKKAHTLLSYVLQASFCRTSFAFGGQANFLRIFP